MVSALPVCSKESGKNRMKEGETEVEERGRRAGEGLQVLAGAEGAGHWGES